MTATIKHQLSSSIPNSELKPYYIYNRTIEPSTNTSQILQSSGSDFESPHLSSGQQSYFRPSTPVHQEHELNQKSFSSGQTPFNLRHYEENLSCGGKYQSNINMSSNAIQPSPVNSQIDLGMLNVGYGLVDSGYHDLMEGYFQDNQRYSPLGGEFVHSGNSLNAMSPNTHTRSTRSTEGNVSRVINKQPSTIIRNGANGELVKVTRVQRSARKRKGNGEKSDKPKLPKLTKPLSELTRDYKDLPVRDMECWVHRSAEVRRQEVEKREGYVTRPMNSFMLYRSAFAERTKQWCLQNNHQVVSSVSGESWPLEPTAIREKYNELAKIERGNHQAAHPGYKFSPSKAQNSKKRKDPKEDMSDNERYIDDDDDMSVIGGSRVRKSARGGKKGVKPPNQIQGGNTASGYMGLCYDHMEGGAQRSSFTHNNPGKTPPMCMGSTDMSGQYYQTTVRANSTTPISHSMHPAIIEDVTIRKTQAPMGVVNQSRLYQMDSIDGYVPQPSFQLPDNSKVDPVLLANEPAYVNAYSNNCQLQNINGDTVFHDEFIDEGNYEASQFDIDRLFAAAADSQIPDINFPDDGVHTDSTGQLEGNGTVSRFDARKLPGYDQNAMQGFLDLDNQEPWNVTGEIINGDQFRYDEWLQ